jgi:hypothetical protein
MSPSPPRPPANPDSDNGQHGTAAIVPVAYQCQGSNVGEMGTVRAGNGATTGGVPFMPVAFALGSHAGAADGEAANSSHKSGGPVGSGISEETAYSLRSARTQAIAFNWQAAGNQTTLGASDEATCSRTASTSPAVAEPVAFDWQAGGGGGDESFRGKSRQYIVRPPGVAGTLNSSRVDAVAFSCKDNGRDVSVEVSPTLRSMTNKDSSPCGGGQVAVVTLDNSGIIERTKGGSLNAATYQADAGTLLPALREQVGAEAFEVWGVGIATAFQPEEVLRPEVHGESVRREAESVNGLVDDALPREEVGAAGTVLGLWQAGCDGCPPRGWQPHEQLARELVAHLSQLPPEGAQAEAFLRDLREAAEGLGLLLSALSAVQEVRRSVGVQGEASESLRGVWRAGERWRAMRAALHAAEARDARKAAENQARSRSRPMAVRRLLPVECEKLQGLPPGWTLVPYRNKPAADGPRYKAIGNGWCRPVFEWVFGRLTMCAEILEGEDG